MSEGRSPIVVGLGVLLGSAVVVAVATFGGCGQKPDYSEEYKACVVLSGQSSEALRACQRYR